MISKEILNFCIEKGLLIDKDVLNLLNNINDIDSIKLIIKEIKQKSQQKIITKKIITNNLSDLEKTFSKLDPEKKIVFEKLKIKLGLNIEISQEIIAKENNSVETNNKENLEKENKEDLIKSYNNASLDDNSVKVKNSYFFKSKKLAVEDFVDYFRNRFLEMKKILQEHSKLTNLISINKLSGVSQNVSIIGIVSDKQITKNKNIMLNIEDLTGKIKVLVNKNKEEIYKKAEEIALDSVLGFKGVGNKEIFFVNDIIFPDAMLSERKKSPKDESILFIGDLHIGSNNFMEDRFLKFIDYLNGKIPGTEEEVSKIKYLVIVGDLIAGVGVYPGQEYELALPDLESHFEKARELLSKIPERIKIIICPGNHDGVRLMEPQPLLDEKYAWPLFDLKNVVLTSNPSIVNIGAFGAFEGFNILLYHGFSFFYYADNITPLMLQKAIYKPELIMKYLLKNRHLAPTHASVQYFPYKEDAHLIKEIPDIFVAGHLHKSAVSYYNNILCVSVSAWESMTDYMEKRGAKPDFCKVPMFNLKTRTVKILDFE